MFERFTRIFREAYYNIKRLIFFLFFFNYLVTYRHKVSILILYNMFSIMFFMDKNIFFTKWKLQTHFLYISTYRR